MSIDKLHIVHVVHRFDTGGLENGVVNLINTLGEQGYQHSIITLKGHNPEFAARIEIDNVQFYDLAKKEGNDLAIFGRLNKLLKLLQPDILHTRNLTTLECQLVGWWRRIKKRIHGEHGWDVNDLGGSNPKYQKLRRLFKHFIHHYVALSSEAKGYLEKKIGVPANKITHICNGVDTDKFSPVPNQCDNLPQAFATEDTVVFGTVGRLAEVKNQQFLLESFIALLKLYPQHVQKIRLLIVGDGVLMPLLLERIEQAGVQQQVFLAGNRSDVEQQMRAMDVFVLPSLAEGISNTFLEAMASGLPVIATNVGGNPDLILPEHAASHLVPANDVSALTLAMAQYVESPAKLQQDSQAVREHCVKNFSIDTMVKKYHQLYQSVS